MSKPYTPQPDSLAGRVCKFFKTNPEEELSQDDIARKWDVTRGSIQSLLSAPVAHNLLRRVTRSGTPAVYCAGDALKTASTVAPAAGLPATSSPWPNKVRTPLQPLDIKAFKVVKKEPPPKRAGPPTTDWPAFFAQLKAKNDAIEDLPISHYGAATKAGQKWAKANGCKLELRKYGATFGMYRTA